MLTSDTATIQDIKGSILFIRTLMGELERGSGELATSSVKALCSDAQAVYALGLRHGQRLMVDALVKVFQVIAKDIDGKELKHFEHILDTMTQENSGRPAVLDGTAHRHVFVARMLANAASLLVTPAPSLDEAVEACAGSLKTVELGVASLESFLSEIEIKDTTV